MINMSYTTQALIEGKLQRALTTTEASMLTLLLPAIDAYINNVTGTTFATHTGGDIAITQYVDVPPLNTNQQRARFTGYYRNRNSFANYAKLSIPTMNNITQVEIATGFNGTFTVLDPSQYIKYPRGENYVYGLAMDGDWNEMADTLRITGFLGYGYVPSDVQLVATSMAITDILGRMDGAKTEKVDQWWIMYDPAANNGAVGSLTAENLAVLKKYKRLSRML